MLTDYHFLSRLAENCTVLGVYADWLDEQGREQEARAWRLVWERGWAPANDRRSKTWDWYKEGFFKPFEVDELQASYAQRHNGESRWVDNLTLACLPLDLLALVDDSSTNWTRSFREFPKPAAAYQALVRAVMETVNVPQRNL